MAIATLLVGLGGTGVEIVSKTLGQIDPEDGHYDRERAGINVDYLVMDTDEQQFEMSDKINENDFDRVITLQPQEDIDIGRIAEECGWFDVRLIRTIESAGRARSVARFLFTELGFSDEFRSRVVSLVDNMASTVDIREEGGAVTTVRVFIVNSLGGGTGSAIFIDTAIAIRNEFEDRNFRVEIVGMGVLPSGLLHKAALDPQAKPNAYAAVSELDDILKGENPTGFPGWIDELPESVFDLYFFIGFSSIKEESFFDALDEVASHFLADFQWIPDIMNEGEARGVRYDTGNIIANLPEDKRYCTFVLSYMDFQKENFIRAFKMVKEISDLDEKLRVYDDWKTSLKNTAVKTDDTAVMLDRSKTLKTLATSDKYLEKVIDELVAEICTLDGEIQTQIANKERIYDKRINELKNEKSNAKGKVLREFITEFIRRIESKIANLETERTDWIENNITPKETEKETLELKKSVIEKEKLKIGEDINTAKTKRNEKLVNFDKLLGVLTTSDSRQYITDYYIPSEEYLNKLIKNFGEADEANITLAKTDEDMRIKIASVAPKIIDRLVKGNLKEIIEAMEGENGYFNILRSRATLLSRPYLKLARRKGKEPFPAEIAFVASDSRNIGGVRDQLGRLVERITNGSDVSGFHPLTSNTVFGINLFRIIGGFSLEQIKDIEELKKEYESKDEDEKRTKRHSYPGFYKSSGAKAKKN